MTNPMLPTLDEAYQWSIDRLVSHIRAEAGHAEYLAELHATPEGVQPPAPPAGFVRLRHEWDELQSRINHPSTVNRMTIRQQIGVERLENALNQATADLRAFGDAWNQKRAERVVRQAEQFTKEAAK